MLTRSCTWLLQVRTHAWHGVFVTNMVLFTDMFILGVFQFESGDSAGFGGGDAGGGGVDNTCDDEAWD